MVICAIRKKSRSSRKKLCSIKVRKSLDSLISELAQGDDGDQLEYLVLPESFDLTIVGDIKDTKTFISHTKIDDPRLQDSLSSNEWFSITPEKL